jgi:SAM-dependent methyltransferase
VTADKLLAQNRRFYDGLWAHAKLIGPEKFNTWTLIAPLAARHVPRLEVGPGLRPRLPISGTVFADISLPALSPLRAAGGHATAAAVTALPFPDGAFRLICAMDIIEHIADDFSAFAELARVAAPGAVLLLSVPLHPHAWTAFDALVGHHRRYEPTDLIAHLARAGFVVAQSAAAGMLPRSSRLKSIGMWFFQHQKTRAMWWYNRVFMPMALGRAKNLALSDGMLVTDGVAGVLLVCRKVSTQAP